MKRYVLSPEAEEDLDTIKFYLLENAGIDVARYVLTALRSGMQFLANTPGAGHRRADLTDHDVLFWSVFSYLIVYNPRPRPIEVVHVFHARRDVATILQSDNDE